MEPPLYTLEFLDVNGQVTDMCHDPISVSVARSFNNPGSASITIPRDWNRNIFRWNSRFKIWRTGFDYKRRLLGDTVWFLQDFHNQVSADQYVLDMDDAFALATKRIVAYTGETVYADKTLEAFDIGGGFTDYFHIDNLMRAYVRENFGSLALDTVRNNPSIIIGSDQNFAPFGEKQAAFAELGSVLNDLANMSNQLGMAIYYDFVPREDGTFLFYVWNGVRGNDRGSSSLNPLILNSEGGALDDIEILDSYKDAKTVCYALGAESGAAQIYKKIEDAVRLAESPFNRIEFAYSATDVSNEDVLTLYGQAALYGRRPRRIASAKLVDNTSFRYGDAVYGDRVVMEVENEAFDVMISAFSVSYSENKENFDIRLSGERPL